MFLREKKNKSGSIGIQIISKERGRYRVLNGFSGTAVLVEAGFISNSGDLNILKTQSTEVGNQIATGIINFLKK